jgi:hypothetical protein
MELNGCCAEMVAYGEGKKCHNPSGDNQELSFELPTTGSVMDARPEVAVHPNPVAFVRDMFIRNPRKSTGQAARESGLSRHAVRTVL